MRRIGLNNYYVVGSEIRISLPNCYVSIKPLFNDSMVYYHLYIINNQRQELVLTFDNLEDAISFTEDTIDNCDSFIEIIEGYEFYKTKYESKKILKNKNFN